jgi:hypothetical protein
VSDAVIQTSATAAETSLPRSISDILPMQKFDIGGAYQMITITSNLTNSVKTGMIPTAMEVPMDATISTKINYMGLQ